MVEAKAEDTILDRRYTYIHDRKYPSEAIDVHNIVVNKTRPNRLLSASSLLALFLLVHVASFLIFLAKGRNVGTLFWSFVLVAVLVKLRLRKSVVKESVVVMPAFGVQLETHYSSGRVTHHFIPVGKILKPVLLECVTPVTCYWSLSLILRDKTDLLPVFKELHPPVKMLVPVWKALCVASGAEGSMHK